MDETKDSLSNVLRILLGIAILSALGITWFYYSNHGGNISHEHGKWAEFGDFFGGILNPIFGFLGLIALLLTIALQTTELRLTRKELSNSSEALKSQNLTLEKNNFENLFFQLIRLHNDIVDSIDMVRGGARPNFNSTPSPVITTKGRDCFRIFLQRYESIYDQTPKTGNDLNRVQAAYSEYYYKYSHEFGHYYRNLINIFEYIDTSDVSNKFFYSSLITAQLSDQELGLLHYDSLSNLHGARFTSLLREYEVLKNIPETTLLDSSHALLGISQE